MWRLLLIGALSLLTVGATIDCGGGQDSSTHISTVVPHINPKAHHRLLVAQVRRHTRVAKANADQPISISFWDTQRGLVAGGYEYQRKCAGTVSLTSDGGRSFQVVLRRPAVIFWVATAGASDAWAQLQRCRKRGHPPRLPELLRTTDGGESWHRVFTGLAWNPSFATATDGFAVAADRGNSYGSIGAGVDSGEVLATSDGGRSWHGDAGLCNRSDDAAVSYPTLAQAWVVCTSTPGGGAQYKTIFSSTDQGRSWQELAQTPGAESSRPPRPTRGYVQRLTFSDSALGLLVLDDGPMYRTEDGGRTWQPLALASFPDFPENRKATYVNSAAILSATTAFALISSGDNGQLQRAMTEDGGQSWTAVHRWPVPRHRR